MTARRQSDDAIRLAKHRIAAAQNAGLANLLHADERTRNSQCIDYSRKNFLISAADGFSGRPNTVQIAVLTMLDERVPAYRRKAVATLLAPPSRSHRTSRTCICRSRIAAKMRCERHAQQGDFACKKTASRGPVQCMLAPEKSTIDQTRIATRNELDDVFVLRDFLSRCDDKHGEKRWDFSTLTRARIQSCAAGRFGPSEFSSDADRGRTAA